MDDDRRQRALATVCHFVNGACRDKVIDKLRKQRHAANQRVYVMKTKACNTADGACIFEVHL